MEDTVVNIAGLDVQRAAPIATDAISTALGRKILELSTVIKAQERIIEQKDAYIEGLKKSLAEAIQEGEEEDIPEGEEVTDGNEDVHSGEVEGSTGEDEASRAD